MSFFIFLNFFCLCYCDFMVSILLCSISLILSSVLSVLLLRTSIEFFILVIVFFRSKISIFYVFCWDLLVEAFLWFFKLCFIDYSITVVLIFPLCPPPLPQAIPIPLFMSVGHVYKFFGFSISYTVLYIPMAILYLPTWCWSIFVMADSKSLLNNYLCYLILGTFFHSVWDFSGSWYE